MNRLQFLAAYGAVPQLFAFNAHDSYRELSIRFGASEINECELPL
jgi:hypothetical protein